MNTDIPSPEPIQNLPVTDTDRDYDLLDKHTGTLALPSTVVETAIDLFHNT